MKNIAIIPARSGSKGLVNKNIKELGGKPLLAYSFEAAKSSGLFDEIVVSTDSAIYADIAKRIGANVPFLRSQELAKDDSSSWDVVKDVLNWYQNKNMFFDTVTLLQPTSPLRTVEDIINAYRVMNEKGANAVVSVCEVDHSPLWSNTLPDDKLMQNFINKSVSGKERQKLPIYYRINGAIYIVKTDYLMKVEDIYSDKCYAAIMKKENSIDIDDEIDFKMAEFFIQDRYKI